MRQVTTARAARLLVVFVAYAGAGFAHDDVPDVNAASLRATYATLQDKLSQNQFQRPIYLDSSESSGVLKGEIHAIVDYPFSTVNADLRAPNHWCDILNLHLNVKYCTANTDKSRSTLTTFFGRKHDEPLDAAHRMEFVFRVGSQNPDYLHIHLDADKGPLGTRNYRIMVEAIPLDGGRTFVHLAYSYGYGAGAAFATQTYLNTFGANKVGFTIVDKRPDGQPVYIGKMRGVLERNTMRYYLAIDVFLRALAVPLPEQFEKRIRDWFAATERYALQLHELDEREYIEMKRSEYRRQQTQ
jgi:hypothetical protein